MLLPLPRAHMGQAEGCVEPSQTLPTARDWPSSSEHGTNNSRAGTPTSPAPATPTQPGEGALDLRCSWIPSKIGYGGLQLFQPSHRSKGTCTPAPSGERQVSVPAKSLEREAVEISTEETDPDLCRAQPSS